MLGISICTLVVMIYTNIQRQFQGYLDTQTLWKSDLEGLGQFPLVVTNKVFVSDLTKKYRLGHLVEQFILQELNEDPSITDLRSNVQFFDEKKTLGEVDFLLRVNERQYQVEAVYKFYLWDPSVGKTSIDHWIGPNRRDSLRLKLDKIKDVQFPIIKNDLVASELSSLGFDASVMDQSVIFKAQLFVPYRSGVDVSPLNSACINGFYIGFDKLDQFSGYQFHIPTKHDWLVKPHFDVEWISFEDGSSRIKESIDEKRSPMVWMMKNYEIIKGFIVFW